MPQSQLAGSTARLRVRHPESATVGAASAIVAAQLWKLTKMCNSFTHMKYTYSLFIGQLFAKICPVVEQFEKLYKRIFFKVSKTLAVYFK